MFPFVLWLPHSWSIIMPNMKLLHPCNKLIHWARKSQKGCWNVYFRTRLILFKDHGFLTRVRWGELCPKLIRSVCDLKNANHFHTSLASVATFWNTSESFFYSESFSFVLLKNDNSVVSDELLLILFYIYKVNINNGNVVYEISYSGYLERFICFNLRASNLS